MLCSGQSCLDGEHPSNCLFCCGCVTNVVLWETKERVGGPSARTLSLQRGSASETDIAICSEPVKPNYK